VALHDFWCRKCGQLLVDVNVPIEVGATAGAPEHCGERMAWLPQVGRMDAACGPGFTAFETYDGRNQPVLVDSLKKLRDIERDSEQRARDGEGQPIVWRRYSQDNSNRDVNTLAPRGWTGGAQPDPAWVRTHGAELRRSADVADTEYGPGVSDATPCALDSLNTNK